MTVIVAFLHIADRSSFLAWCLR